MCNKLCNYLFTDVLAKRPALDAWSLWPVSDRPESGRFGCSGRAGGVQSLDALTCVESTCFGLKVSGQLDHALGDSINARVRGLTNLRSLWLT